MMDYKDKASFSSAVAYVCDLFVAPRRGLQFLFSPVSIAYFLVVLSGCQSGPVVEGRKTFDRYCAPCHGDTGAGNGYNAENLDPHARDLTDEAYMSKLENNEIYEVIEKGGAGVDLSPTMPSFGLVFSPQEVWSLVAYIRTLHKNDKEVKFDEAKPYSTKRPRVKPVAEADFDALFSEKAADDAMRAELIGLGEGYFDDYGCVGCHRVRGKGGELGPDLSRAGFMLQPQFIYRWVRNPQSFKPDTRMPNLNLSDEDALAVSLYLGTLKDPASDEKAVSTKKEG